MRIVLLITVLEGVVLSLWLLMRRHYKNLPSPLRTAPLEGSLVAVSDYPLQPRNASRWAFINESPAEGQADDRSPMLNSVAATSGAPAARRSSARRSHQLQFKKWSTARHD